MDQYEGFEHQPRVVLIHTLLGDPNPNRIIALGEPFFGALNPEREEVSAALRGAAYGWLRLIANNRLFGTGGVIDLSKLTGAKGAYEIPSSRGIFAIGYVLGAQWREDTLTALGFLPASGPGSLSVNSARLVRASLQPASTGGSRTWVISDTPEVLWHIDDHGWTAESPFLSDGSVAVVREQEIVWVSGAGKPLKSFALRAIPRRVSIGLDDTIMALEATGSETRLHLIGKERRLKIELGQRRSRQPPLSLPGGRIVVVTEDSVVNIANGKIVWEWRYDSHVPLDPKPKHYVPPDWEMPVAAGTLDGCVVVRWEQQVVTLDPNGKPIWRMRTPDRILSNPLVTANGGVCVAIPDRVICEIP